MLKLNTVNEIDCFDLLQGLEDNSADLIVLDPNYQDWEMLIDKRIIELSLSKIKPTGNILMFTKKPYDHKLRCYIDVWFRNEFIWNYIKTGNWVSNGMPTYSYHKIFWCCKDKSYFNPRTGIKYSANTQQGNKGYMTFQGYRKKSKFFENHPDGIWLNDLLQIERSRENNGKTPTKPLKLCQILTKCFCPKNGLLIDPFMGAGNFIVSAKKEKVNFIGGDIEPNLVNFVKDKLLPLEYQLL
jgi:site-specific DNA-methyltransferase (adenine-specific)